VFGYIVDRHPEARIFSLSPAVALLRKGEELLPLLDTPGVTDTGPLIAPNHRGPGTKAVCSDRPGVATSLPGSTLLSKQ
jgi:hypothetical protein